MTDDECMHLAVHPGRFLKHVLDNEGLTVTAAAINLELSRTHLSNLLHEKCRLTADLALRIERSLGISMETLLTMQMRHDIREVVARDGRPR